MTSFPWQPKNGEKLCRIESEAHGCKLIVFILQESKIHLNFAGAEPGFVPRARIARKPISTCPLAAAQNVDPLFEPLQFSKRLPGI